MTHYTRNGNEIWVRTHALKRAVERGITPSMIEATILGGRIQKFGKNRVKFIKQYKRGKVICVDECIRQNTILIVTIEWGK